MLVSNVRKVIDDELSVVFYQMIKVYGAKWNEM